MLIGHAQARARQLLRENGLAQQGWSLVLDNAKGRLGQCRHAKKEISLSRAHLPALSEDDVDQLLFHEIAHALVGATHKHDTVWRAKARSLGYRGGTTSTAGAKLETAWVGTCPAGHEHGMHRAPLRVRACGKCGRAFSVHNIIVWKKDGQTVRMPDQYVDELERILGTARPIPELHSLGPRQRRAAAKTGLSR